jgi:hypothetical protein
MEDQFGPLPSSRIPLFLIGQWSTRRDHIRRRRAFAIESTDARESLRTLFKQENAAESVRLIAHISGVEAASISVNAALKFLNFEVQLGDDIFAVILEARLSDTMTEAILVHASHAAQYEAAFAWLYKNRFKLEFTPRLWDE